MTRSELVLRLSARHGLTRLAARKVVDAVFDGIADGLAEGRWVELRGFGTMRPRHHPAYTGRNPKTGELVQVDPKVLPAFRAGRALLHIIQEET